uniref:DUF908 domain-containing protein n=1 Tax=Heterorhabditis bacteriophora TaxID=37862 RepID=A0A1I7X3Y5_HETBA
MEDDTITSSPLPFRVLQLLNLSQEVALVVLDSLQTFAQQLASRRSKTLLCSEELFYRLLSLHLLLLEEHWPEAVRLHAIAALALFVNMFRVRLFESGPLDALSILIERILLQMTSRLTTVQTAVAALLQLVLRNGYETTQSYLASQAMAISVAASVPKKPVRIVTSAERLGRPGAQTGVALARLLGIKSAISSSSRFEKGLTALENLVMANEIRKITSFDRAVLVGGTLS